MWLVRFGGGWDFLPYEINDRAYGKAEECATEDVAGIVFAEIDTAEACGESPKEGQCGDNPTAGWAVGGRRCVGVCQGGGLASTKAIAQGEEDGQGEAIGGVGTDKAVLPTTTDAEHVDVGQGMARSQTAEHVFEAKDGDAVAQEEADGNAQPYSPPARWFAAQRYQSKEQYDDNGPREMGGEKVEKPVEKGRVVGVDEIEQLGVEMVEIL